VSSHGVGVGVVVEERPGHLDLATVGRRVGERAAVTATAVEAGADRPPLARYPFTVARSPSCAALETEAHPVEITRSAAARAPANGRVIWSPLNRR
jgi:hypothetical protein